MDPGELNDGEIIECVRAGDVAQFSRLVDRYQGPLLALAINRLGQKDLAEDAVQEAFFCAFKWLDSYDSKFAFRTWLWTILLNQCRRTAERERRIERVQSGFANEVLQQTCDEFPSPDRQLESRENDRALRSALRKLPEVHADAIRLRFFGELKFEAIAQAMGCSLRTAKYRVKEGLVKLGDLLRGGSAHAYDTKDEVPSGKSTNEAPHALR